MKKRDNRTSSEINIHMGKAKTGVNITAPFMVDEYCCIICNAYFRKKIYESDLQVIEDLIQFFVYLIVTETICHTQNADIMTN